MSARCAEGVCDVAEGAGADGVEEFGNSVGPRTYHDRLLLHAALTSVRQLATLRSRAGHSIPSISLLLWGVYIAHRGFVRFARDVDLARTLVLSAAFVVLLHIEVLLTTHRR